MNGEPTQEQDDRALFDLADAQLSGRAGETLVVALCVALWLWMLFTRIDQ